MRFLVDACVGRRVAEWLEGLGHDAIRASELGPDPGDRALLDYAAREQRIVITADKDFGTLIFLRGSSHAGVIRLPQVPVPQRIALLSTLFERHRLDEITGTIVTVRASGIRISRRDW